MAGGTRTELVCADKGGGCVTLRFWRKLNTLPYKEMAMVRLGASQLYIVRASGCSDGLVLLRVA